MNKQRRRSLNGIVGAFICCEGVNAEKLVKGYLVVTCSKLSMKISAGKFCGSLVGTFVGDALGMPLEGWSAQEIETSYGLVDKMLEARLGKGTYTDDTEMMIGLAESLLSCGQLNPADLSLKFLDNFHAERGYGFGTCRVLEQLKAGTAWDKAAGSVFPGGSYGNGSAMRVAPLGIFYYDLPPQLLREAAYASSRVTHTHPLGLEGAALQTCAIARALRENPDEELDVQGFISDLIDFCRPAAEVFKERLSRIKFFLQSPPAKEEIIRCLGNDSTAFGSVPSAIYSFLAHYSSFPKAIGHAVSLGGDSDTIGAMTGAIAGAYHGLAGIPKSWLDCLENKDKGRDYVIDLAQRLWKLKFKA